MSSNPHYDGAAEREQMLKAWRGETARQVKASPGETMRRMSNTAPRQIGSRLSADVAAGYRMVRWQEQDRRNANQVRLQYRRDRVKYLLGQ